MKVGQSTRIRRTLARRFLSHNGLLYLSAMLTHVVSAARLLAMAGSSKLIIRLQCQKVGQITSQISGHFALNAIVARVPVISNNSIQRSASKPTLSDFKR